MGGEKACWKTVLLEAPETSPSALPELSRHERLAALYRFQNGQPLADLRLVDPARRAELTDPAQIDWTHFPVVDALEAVTRDELRRLRSLLRAEASSAGRAPTPPNGMVWGVDLRNPQLFLDARPEVKPSPPSSEA